MRNILFLSNSGKFENLTNYAVTEGFKAVCVESLDQLVEMADSCLSEAPNAALISFATGVIVPENILQKFKGRAFNVHPATPEYPGRDPHHFACFDSVSEYGATAHVMTKKVDAGSIILTSKEATPIDTTPEQLMEIAERHGEKCIQQLLSILANGADLPQSSEKWGEHKTTRLDFKSFCRISPLDTPEDTDRRIRAANTKQYKNAYVDLNGHRFTYEGPTPFTDVHKRDKKRWSQFTEEEYRQILIDTKRNYTFATYNDGREGKHVIWRHDLDHSIEQAYELAKIEHEEGVVASYMFVLRLPYYNMLEHDAQLMAKEILKLGHKAGLHFDVACYEKDDWTEEELEEVMAKEKALLEDCIDAPVEAMSYHDPECGNLLRFRKDVMAGMVNCYGETLQRDYEYCSDSNGYWRHRPIPEVIRSGEFERIHVLTHPEWWTPEAMPPRNRIERAKLWRAQDVMKIYDEHLERSGRKNIR